MILAYYPSIVQSLYSTGNCHYARKTFIVKATGEPSGKMVENMNKNTNFEGSNSTTGTGNEKIV
jgi:hypothetical protein